MDFDQMVAFAKEHGLTKFNPLTSTSIPGPIGRTLKEKGDPGCRRFEVYTFGVAGHPWIMRRTDASLSLLNSWGSN